MFKFSFYNKHAKASALSFFIVSFIGMLLIFPVFADPASDDPLLKIFDEMVKNSTEPSQDNIPPSSSPGVNPQNNNQSISLPMQQNSGNSFKPIAEGMVIEMRPDDPFMYINGISVEIDPGRATAPLIEDGRTLIPIASLVNVLGGTTTWEDETKTITVELNANVIQFGLNRLDVTVNDVPKILDVAPKVVDGRTLVPVRFLVENCNLTIEWVNKTIVLSANDLPEGIQKTKNLLDKTTEIENFHKLPTITHLFSRIY